MSKLREMLKDKEALCAAVHEELDCKEWDTTEQLKNNRDITAHFLSQAGPESILGGPAASLPHTLTPSSNTSCYRKVFLAEFLADDFSHSVSNVCCLSIVK